MELAVILAIVDVAVLVVALVALFLIVGHTRRAADAAERAAATNERQMGQLQQMIALLERLNGT